MDTIRIKEEIHEIKWVVDILHSQANKLNLNNEVFIGLLFLIITESD